MPRRLAISDGPAPLRSKLRIACSIPNRLANRRLGCRQATAFKAERRWRSPSQRVERSSSSTYRLAPRSLSRSRTSSADRPTRSDSANNTSSSSGPRKERMAQRTDPSGESSRRTTRQPAASNTATSSWCDPSRAPMYPTLMPRLAYRWLTSDVQGSDRVANSRDLSSTLSLGDTPNGATSPQVADSHSNRGTRSGGRSHRAAALSGWPVTSADACFGRACLEAPAVSPPLSEGAVASGAYCSLSGRDARRLNGPGLGGECVKVYLKLIVAFSLFSAGPTWAHPAGGGEPSPSPASPRPTVAVAAPAKPANSLVVGVGVVQAIDRNAGRITLAYEPIEPLNWPAGSMSFVVSKPSVLEARSVGERVRFRLESHQITALTAF